MLTFLGDGKRYCDGMSRRDFLTIGALGAGLTLADVYRARAAAATAAAPESPRPKSAILIFLTGGPSHIDSYDPKPDAPAEFRGPFRPIQTNVPGIRICEHLPRQARLLDKIAVLRSVTASTEEHNDSRMMTGYSMLENQSAHHPSIAAVVSRVRPGTARDIPPAVCLRGAGVNIGFQYAYDAGFLGMAHRPFITDNGTFTDTALRNLSPRPNLPAARVASRRSLLNHFDSVRRDVDASGSMSAMDSYTTRAFDMIATGAVRRALDLSNEPAPIRDRYRGVENFLTARRLVEAGVGCVTMTCFFTGRVNWDSHNSIVRDMPEMLWGLDRGLSNLLEDLHARGMQDDVVTLAMGEFGRTPRLNPGGGRDHYPPVMSAVVAGGGLTMGQAIGATTSKGEFSRGRPYTVQNVLSTIYRTIGIDPSLTFPNHTGRPIYLLEDRAPVQELL